jgi:hypothetical protein
MNRKFYLNLFFNSKTNSKRFCDKIQTNFNKTQRSSENLKNIKEIPDLKSFLTDSFGRFHDYLRISLTERCNLRCQVKLKFTIVLHARARSRLNKK